MAGLVDTFCIQSIPQTSLEFLMEKVTEYNIVIADDKKDDKAFVIKQVIKHLVSDAVTGSLDHGAALFLKLYGELGGELKKLSVKQEPQEGGEDDKDELSYRRLRQFKINGTIGEPGQKNCLSYSSLCYQIKQGEGLKYTQPEIYAAVIKAIEAGNPFRDVLELEADAFDKKAFMKSLRSHFKVRDPNEVFNQLRTCVQGPSESAHKFCCRCVALKKKVQAMSEAEDLPFDDENLQATFFRTIYTGLRQQSIRNELRQVLKEASIGDADLLMEVSEAEANEEERVKKLNEGRGKTVSMNKLTAGSDSDEPEPDDPNDSASGFSSSSTGSANSNNTNNTQLSKSARRKAAKAKKASLMSVSQQNNQQNSQVNTAGQATSADINKLTQALQDMAASNAKLTADVFELKKMAGNSVNNNKPSTPSVRFANPTSPSNNNGGRVMTPAHVLNPSVNNFMPRYPNRGPSLCGTCQYYNVSYCNHCLRCGSTQHKIRECPEN